MQNWEIKKLCELGDIVGGATPSTNRDDYYNGEIAWLTPKDLAGYNSRYISRGERSITMLGLDSCSAKILPKGSILFTSRAPIGYIAIAQNDICTNQGFKSIVPNADNDSMFLYYLLQYNKAKIEAMGSGTTFKEVSGAVMKNIEVLVPSLEEQKKISAILSSIDDKIELNNRINKNLEAQAQAIFKSWFVDFEPFQDGEFVDSELGQIPEGWKVGTIANLGDIVGGSTPSKAKPEYYTDKGIAWLTPKDLSIQKNKFIFHGETDITELGLKNSSARLMPKGTVLFSSRAPIGYMAIAGNEVSTNQGFKSIVPFSYIGTPYVYFYLKTNLERIESSASGSTFREVSGSTMKNIPALIPCNNALIQFTQLCDTIFLQQQKLEQQNRTLSKLRDTLLPKLMSGEIQIPQEV